MSIFDDPDGVEPSIPKPGHPAPSHGVGSLLVETLMHVLIEKGVMTKNDALSVIQTVAEVVSGAQDASAPEKAVGAELAALHRLFASFEMIDDRPGTVVADEGNVRRLRPPSHGDHPHFPDSD